MRTGRSSDSAPPTEVVCTAQTTARQIFDAENVRATALEKVLKQARLRFDAGIASHLDVLDVERNLRVPLRGMQAAARRLGLPEPEVRVEYRPRRQRLPKSRASRTTSFAVGGAEGYMTAGAYDDGRLGEVFLKLGKQGSTLAGVMDAFSIAISIALQYGVPLETYVQKFTNMKFEPAGMTDDADVRMAQSIIDYIFRRLALDYLTFDERAELGIHTSAERARYVETGSYLSEEDEANLIESEALKNDAGDEVTIHEDGPNQPALVEARPHSTAEVLEKISGLAIDAPLCMTCGTKMRRSGSCYICEGCGSTSGCS